jgi:hypothetical protein
MPYELACTLIEIHGILDVEEVRVQRKAPRRLMSCGMKSE